MTVSMMKFKWAIVFVSIVFCSRALSQTRNLTGKVIDQEFQALGVASIWSVDTVKLADVDINGKFSLSIASDVKMIIILGIGMEGRRIELSNDCDSLEVVMMFRPTYCFDKPRKVDRMRRKDFEKLPELHQLAFKKGIFSSERPCYSEKFMSSRVKVRR